MAMAAWVLVFFVQIHNIFGGQKKVCDVISRTTSISSGFCPLIIGVGRWAVLNTLEGGNMLDPWRWWGAFFNRSPLMIQGFGAVVMVFKYVCDVKCQVHIWSGYSETPWLGSNFIVLKKNLYLFAVIKQVRPLAKTLAHRLSWIERWHYIPHPHSKMRQVDL